MGRAEPGPDPVRQLITGRRLKLMIIAVFALLALVAGVVFVRYYHLITKPVIDLGEQPSTFFHIYTGSGFTGVRDSLLEKGFLTDPGAFEWLAIRKKYPEKIRPGRYRLLNGMRNNALVNLLRSGRQEPVRITIHNINTPAALAGRIGRHLEVDSLRLTELFSDRTFLANYKLTPATVLIFFIPDTYEFYWNTSGEQLFERMQKEFEHFWNPRRKYLADSLQLSVNEVITLASIVEKETLKNDEKTVIAGVYLNRLKKRMPLQADPTVIYALNDYSIRRVLKVHTRVKSPYNTYLHAGLPPGPICLPSVASVDAVLNASNHSYYYFCAREDLSGYHNFASDLAGHNRNARRYQVALDKMKIR
jgi:UPF0755 protein